MDPMDKEHKDPDAIDLGAPRIAQYMHKAWKKHQNTVYWVDINLAQKKGLKFYQTRSNAIILHKTLPAYCIPKVVRMETGEVIYEKVYASPRPPPKISLKHDWMKELGSEVARQPEGEVARHNQTQIQIMIERGDPLFSEEAYRSQEIDTRFSRESKNSILKEDAIHGRTGRPVVCSQRASQTRFSRESQNSISEEDAIHDRTVRAIVCSQRASQTRFSRESQNSILEEQANHDRTGRPVVCSQPVGSSSTFNEVDIDFRISGLPHSVVKQAENYRVRELVKEIENHPHRQALQADLQQNNAYNPFNEKNPRRRLNTWAM